MKNALSLSGRMVPWAIGLNSRPHSSPVSRRCRSRNSQAKSSCLEPRPKPQPVDRHAEQAGDGPVPDLYYTPHLASNPTAVMTTPSSRRSTSPGGTHLSSLKSTTTDALSKRLGRHFSRVDVSSGLGVRLPGKRHAFHAGGELHRLEFLDGRLRNPQVAGSAGRLARMHATAGEVPPRTVPWSSGSDLSSIAWKPLMSCSAAFGSFACTMLCSVCFWGASSIVASALGRFRLQPAEPATSTAAARMSKHTVGFVMVPTRFSILLSGSPASIPLIASRGPQAANTNLCSTGEDKR